MHQHLFSVVMCTCMYVVMGETTLRFRARKNTKLSEDCVNKTVTIDSMMMCVTLCKTEQTFLCQSASWGNGTCLTSDAVTIHEEDNSDVISKENWITMCRIVYPVFLAQGSGGRYSLTFREAKPRCLQSESRIASRNDLLDARNIGFDMCRCAWLSDGTKGFVVQKDPVGCWYTWHTGIVKCSEKDIVGGDVYCKSVLF